MIEVQGGAGGTSADLAAMAAAGGRLRADAAELRELCATVVAVAADVDLLQTAALDLPGWAATQRALAGCVAGSGGLGAVGVRVEGLGTAVLSAALAYAEADRVAAAALTSTRTAVAGSAGHLLFRVGVRYAAVVAPAVLLAATGVLLWRTGDLVVAAAADTVDDARAGTLEVTDLDDRVGLLAGRLWFRLVDDAEQAGTAALGWAARHPEVAEEAVAALPAFLSGASGLDHVMRRAETRGGPGGAEAGPWSFPPEDVDDLAVLVALAGYGTGLIGRSRVTVRAAALPPPQPARPPHGVTDLVRGAAALSPRRDDGTVRGEPGRIRVERVTSAGRRAAVVYVPATQAWDLGHGTNPMDATGNLDAIAGLESAAQSSVVLALRSAGVGRSEPVLLVGHSQGGLTSVALAGDREFRREFTPAAVLTVGAPVGGATVPDDVAVLSVEHAEDLVTVVDGAPNPDQPNWATVRREVLHPETGDAEVRAAVAADPLAPHDLDSYARTAELVDASEHPSVIAWRERAAPFLDAPGATSSASDWVAERER